jgi:NAD(P)H-dependent FMN reductase
MAEVGELFIPVILGTAREGRQSEKVARIFVSEAAGAGVESELLDVRDYRLPATDRTGAPEQARRLSERAARADAFVIVSPEYNYGFPGELKMMLDMLVSEWAGKPVAICGVSSGMMGGCRMVEAIKPLLVKLGMHPIVYSVYIQNVESYFDESGEPRDKECRRRVRKVFAELARLAPHLSAARAGAGTA